LGVPALIPREPKMTTFAGVFAAPGEQRPGASRARLGVDGAHGSFCTVVSEPTA